MGLASSLRKDVLSLDAEMLGGSQQASIIGTWGRRVGRSRACQKPKNGGAVDHELKVEVFGLAYGTISRHFG